jgi:hypothetical protein
MPDGKEQEKKLEAKVRKAMNKILAEQKRMPVRAYAPQVTEIVVRSGPTEELIKLRSLEAASCDECCDGECVPFATAWHRPIALEELSDEDSQKLLSIAKASGKEPEEVIYELERQTRIELLSQKIGDSYIKR